MGRLGVARRHPGLPTAGRLLGAQPLGHLRGGSRRHPSAPRVEWVQVGGLGIPWGHPNGASTGRRLGAQPLGYLRRRHRFRPLASLVERLPVGRLGIPWRDRVLPREPCRVGCSAARSVRGRTQQRGLAQMVRVDDPGTNQQREDAQWPTAKAATRRNYGKGARQGSGQGPGPARLPQPTGQRPKHGVNPGTGQRRCLEESGQHCHHKQASYQDREGTPTTSTSRKIHRASCRQSITTRRECPRCCRSPETALGRRMSSGRTRTAIRCPYRATLRGDQARLRLPPKAARTAGPPRTGRAAWINRAKRSLRRGRSTPPRGP